MTWAILLGVLSAAAAAGWNVIVTLLQTYGFWDKLTETELVDLSFDPAIAAAALADAKDKIDPALVADLVKAHAAYMERRAALDASIAAINPLASRVVSVDNSGNVILINPRQHLGLEKSGTKASVGESNIGRGAGKYAASWVVGYTYRLKPTWYKSGKLSTGYMVLNGDGSATMTLEWRGGMKESATIILPVKDNGEIDTERGGARFGLYFMSNPTTFDTPPANIDPMSSYWKGKSIPRERAHKETFQAYMDYICAGGFAFSGGFNVKDRLLVVPDNTVKAQPLPAGS